MPRFDLIVIGTGPGGEGAAMNAIKHGKRVAVVERHPDVGGGCTHWGTIPSKAIRHVVFSLAERRQDPFGRRDGEVPRFAELVRAASGVTRKQSQMRLGFYERNGVTIYRGHARLAGPDAVEVCEERNACERIEADAILLAPGSRPYRPAGVDFGHPRILDSDTVLQLKDTPQSITIYGAGVIGCEYASMFRNLGIKVNLVNTRDRLLAFLDDEIVDALAYHLRDQGVLIRHGEEAEGVDLLDDGAVLRLKSGKRFKTDALLWANGRCGNVEDLGLERVGIVPDSRGQIRVDAVFRTSVPSILAVGDVIGPPSLASAAYDQGRAAVAALYGLPDRDRLATDIPTGIYTSPEISSLGRTERELTAAKVPYEVGHALFRSLARAQIVGQPVGMLKLLFHRETRELLGIHCFGNQAAEIVHIGQAVMRQPAPHNTLDYFATTTFNYPTMAEAYRVAALNGLNRLF